MATVRNNTARQFNLKAQVSKGTKIVVVRLVPGLNSVDDTAWKSVCQQAFVKDLIAKRNIETGREVDNAVLSEDAVEAKVATKAVSKKAQKAREALDKELAEEAKG